MKILSILKLLACMTIVSGVGSAAIVNASFEQPVTSGYIYDPLDPNPGGWVFFGHTGVAANTFFTPPPSNGTQAAFIQQYLDQPDNLSSITETLTGVLLAPSTLTFSIAQRPGFSANPITVLYGNQNLGTFTPASSAFTTVTINFTPTVSSGSLVFRSSATTVGDLDTAIDNVALSTGAAVPEPVSILLVTGGLALVAVARRRRLQK